MCGHVGIAGNLDADAMKIVKQLLYMDALRGEHGTGLAFVPWSGTSRDIDDVTVLKSPAPAWEFLNNSAVKSALRSTSHSVVIGHNRHATQGAHVFENTHPFINDTIVGAHNGTVDQDNLKSLVNIDDDFEGFGTDSETILSTLSRMGPKDTLGALTDGYRGAWALVWYDTTDNTINFVRNDERTLYYILSKDRSELVWASEAYMLKAAIQRNDPTAFDLAEVKAFETNTTYSWGVPAVGQVFREEPSTEKTPGKKYVAPKRSRNTTTTSGGTANRRRSGSNLLAWSGGGTTHNANRNVVMPPSTFNFLLNSFELQDDDILRLFTRGEPDCSNCQANIPVEDFQDGSARSVDSNTHVCKDCVKAAQEAAADRTYHRYAKIQ